MGCLHKVDMMASDNVSFWYSLQSKIREFECLGYPRTQLRAATERMYARNGDGRWLQAKQLLTDAEE